MANFSPFFFVFVVVTFLVPEVLAITNHIVGDASGWTTGVDYSSWASDKTFFVGDNLVFNYEKGKHNVLNVDVSSFARCSAPKDQPPLVTGNDVISLTTPGTKWFICSISTHCNSGQRLIISVETPPPNAGQSPTTPPPVIQAPTLTPPAAGQAPPLPSSLPPAPSPSLPPPPPPPPATTFPSAPPPPGRNQTSPHLPIAPSPMQNMTPLESPGPSPLAAAPPPSRAVMKSAVSGHVGFLAMAVAILAGIMI